MGQPSLLSPPDPDSLEPGFQEWLDGSTTSNSATSTTTRSLLAELLAEDDYLEKVAALDVSLDGLGQDSPEWESLVIDWGRGVCTDLDVRLHRPRVRERYLDNKLARIEEERSRRLTVGVIELAIVHLCPHHLDLLG